MNEYTIKHDKNYQSISYIVNPNGDKIKRFVNSGDMSVYSCHTGTVTLLNSETAALRKEIADLQTEIVALREQLKGESTTADDFNMEFRHKDYDDLEIPYSNNPEIDKKNFLKNAENELDDEASEDTTS